jgi:hypothetical protein
MFFVGLFLRDRLPNCISVNTFKLSDPVAMFNCSDL